MAYVRPLAESEKKPVSLQIDAYVPIGDGSRDRGEKIHTLYFNEDGINLAYQYSIVESYALADILSIDCYKAAKPRNNDVASMAAAGFVLGGAVGAVAGGIVGAADTGSWYFEIVTRGKSRTVRLQSESSKKGIVRWAESHGLMTKEGESIPCRGETDVSRGNTKYELNNKETRLIESYRSLLPEFQDALHEQADSLYSLQTRVLKNPIDNK